MKKCCANCDHIRQWLGYSRDNDTYYCNVDGHTLDDDEAMKKVCDFCPLEEWELKETKKIFCNDQHDGETYVYVLEHCYECNRSTWCNEIREDRDWGIPDNCTLPDLVIDDDLYEFLSATDEYHQLKNPNQRVEIRLVKNKGGKDG